MIQVVNSSPSEIFSFVRLNDQHKVFAVFNFSAEQQKVSFSDTLYHGDYRDFSSRDQVTLTAGHELDMPPWSYRVFTN